MSNGPLGQLVRRVRRLVKTDDEPSDRDLLGRFVNERDEAAFARLMDRHGPLVRGVCRRLLHDDHDAEDACQAVFLVLARKAASIRKRTSLASWLHGVAYRVAARLRDNGVQRRTQIGVPSPEPEAKPTADLSWREAQALLDEELQHLPERLRLPLVLCYLEGKTRDEAAGELGWRVSTFRGRLERARKLLRGRLERRGVFLSTGLLATLFPSAAGASPVQSSMRLAPASERAANLAEGMVRAMFLTKLNQLVLACCSLLAAGVLVVGLSSFGRAVPQSAGVEPASQPRGRGDKKERPAKTDPDNELAEPVKKSIDAGIRWLRNNRGPDGTWENTSIGFLQRGGVTALALRALLQAGVDPDDTELGPAINFIRQVPPEKTYVVGLQTAVLCRVNKKKDADLIKRNVAWLENAAVRDDDGSLLGWGYEARSGQPDNSNTQYAIMGLHAAAEARFPPQNKDLWNEIREYYLSTQGDTGGWGYHSDRGFPPSQTMTSAALCGLLITDRMLKPTKDSKRAAEQGFAWIGKNFTLKTGGHSFYNLHGIARAGTLSGRKTFDGPQVKHDWYREGCEILTGLKPKHRELAQQEDGSWTVSPGLADGLPVVSTSFALLFLSAKD
jgi:RNA polymerase sigma factor (sigma-70 family)